MKPVATLTSMHVCPMCTGAVPHVGGPVIGPGQPNILMNGKPVAVMGDMCTCAGPPDTIVMGNPSILMNGVPVACMGDMTAHGGSIMMGEPNILMGSSAPKPSAIMSVKDIPFPKITFADRAVASMSGNGDKLKEAEKNQAAIKEEAEAQEADTAQEVLEVTLTSEYAMLEAREFARQFSHATFYLFMRHFFGEDIPIRAYKELYDKMSNREYLNPKIKVLAMGSASYASFYKQPKLVEAGVYQVESVELRISETLIRNAATGETEDIKNKALETLFKALLEEHGHYLDYLLRFVYSSVKGDAVGDEGASMSHMMIKDLQERKEDNKQEKKEKRKGFTYSEVYCKNMKEEFLLTTYNPFEQDKIEFAKATVDGAQYTLSLDLSALKLNLEEEKARMEADLQTANEEFFASGEGNPKFEHYGHLGIEKVLEDKKIVTDKQLSHIYLGNYMRDMSQLITPLFAYLKEEEKAKLDAVEKDLYGFEWLDSIKLTREGLCNVVELLAANQMNAIVTPSGPAKSIGGKGGQIMDPAPAPANPVKDYVENVCTKLGLKGIQTALNYRLFVRHYGGFRPEELGVYRPEEHLDSPVYATVFDNINNDIYFCPPEEKPAFGSHYGMKRHIRNEEGGKDKTTDTIGKGTGKYAGGKLPTAASYMEEEFRAFHREYECAGSDERAQNKALRRLGNGLHVLEDFFAHTNFVELSLIKMGIAVYPWVEVDDPQLKYFQQTGKPFTVDRCEEKTYNSPKGRLFSTREEVEFFYPKFNLLDEFAAKGFYFSTNYGDKDEDERIFVAIEQKDHTYFVKPALNGRVVRAGIDYIQQLPLVSGYFSSLDTIHSLIHVLEGAIKVKEITVKGVLMENDGISGSKWEKFAMDVGDMIVLHILADLKLSQKEKGKSGTETGVDYSKIMELYISFIEYRQIFISVLTTLKKSTLPVMIFIELAVRMINVTQTAIVNMIKSIVVQAFELLAKSTTAFQNMELHRKIGTDPSHSQLAKDHTEHPLHSLAAEMAKEAVTGVGQFVKLYFEQKKDVEIGKSLTEAPVTAEKFIEAAHYFMIHPAQSHWMDGITEKWVAGHGKKLRDLNKEEKDRKEMDALGVQVTITVEELKAQLRELVEFTEEVQLMMEQKKNELKQQVKYFKRMANKLQHAAKEEYSTLIEEMETSYNRVRRQLEYNLAQLQQENGQANDALKKEAAEALEQYQQESEAVFDKALNLLKEFSEGTMESIEQLQEFMEQYYRNTFKEHQHISTLEAKVYAYTKEQSPKDAQLIENFYKQQQEQYASLQRYMQSPPETMLASLQKQDAKLQKV